MNETINIEDYNYELPEERIAQTPLTDRSASKLLVYNKGNISDSHFRNILKYIPENSFLTFNNTKVINARIFFKKSTGAKIEIFCLEPSGTTVEKSFTETKECAWNCMVGNASKWRDEILEKIFTIEGKTRKLYAKKEEVTDDGFVIRFYWDGGFSFSEVMHEAGSTPLPPYIKRKADKEDSSRYQTVFAEIDGSVAAPTAGLHFTNEIMNELKESRTPYDYITLNVGAGTFKPMKTDNVYRHHMHKEVFSVKKRFLENLLNNIDKVKVSVGTTSVRTIESIYWLGAIPDKLKARCFEIEQWEVYEHSEKSRCDSKTALMNIMEWMEKKGTDIIEGSTSLMIVPGYKFKMTDAIITNFHLPGSTLLLLVSAFTGSDWKKIYDYALRNDFRFLSYGDSSILIP